MTIMADRLDARNLGALFMLFQVAVVYAGALYGVDPLDQPGVELAKRLTRDFMLEDAAVERSAQASRPASAPGAPRPSQAPRPPSTPRPPLDAPSWRV